MFWFNHLSALVSNLNLSWPPCLMNMRQNRWTSLQEGSASCPPLLWFHPVSLKWAGKRAWRKPSWGLREPVLPIICGTEQGGAECRSWKETRMEAQRKCRQFVLKELELVPVSLNVHKSSLPLSISTRNSKDVASLQLQKPKIKPASTWGGGVFVSWVKSSEVSRAAVRARYSRSA